MIVEKVPEEIVMNLFSTRYLDSVRKKTEEIARRMGFDDEQVFDLALVVDEAYVNAGIIYPRKRKPLAFLYAWLFCSLYYCSTIFIIEKEKNLL